MHCLPCSRCRCAAPLQQFNAIASSSYVQAHPLRALASPALAAPTPYKCGRGSCAAASSTAGDAPALANANALPEAPHTAATVSAPSVNAAPENTAPADVMPANATPAHAAPTNTTPTDGLSSQCEPFDWDSFDWSQVPIAEYGALGNDLVGMGAMQHHAHRCRSSSAARRCSSVRTFRCSAGRRPCLATITPL